MGERSVKIGRGVRQRRCLSPILFNFYNEYFTKKGFEGFGDFKIGGQVILTVKCADDFVLLAKEETRLEGVIDRIIEIGIFCEMGIIIEETKAVRISRQRSSLHSMIDKK
jgi:hypothetical protein